MDIYIEKNGKQSGPHQRTDILAKLKSGELGPDDWAWSDGMPDWKPLKEVVGGISVATIPQPTPVAKVVAPIMEARPLAKKSAPQKAAGGGGRALVWVLLLAAVGAGGYWAWQHPNDVNRLIGESKQFIDKTAGSAEQPKSSPTSSPGTASSIAKTTATTPNQATSATPNQTSVSSPGLSAADLDAIAAMPSRWPKSVTLTKNMKFPIVIDGRAAGSVVLPAGTTVSLRMIKNGKLTIQHQNSAATVAAADTDLMDRLARVGALRAASQPMGTGIVSGPETPSNP